MRLKSDAASGSASRRPSKCPVNTAEIPLSNKLHRRQSANPHGIRTAVVKFNKLLEVDDSSFQPNHCGLRSIIGTQF